MSAGRTFALQRLAHQPHRLERRLLGTRVRRVDDDVACLDRVDRVAGRREVRVRGRDDARDDACRLAVFHDALLRQLLDDADALLAQRIAQHPADLHPLAHPADRVAQAAFLDAHVDEAREGLLVRDGPRHRLAEAVHACLIVGLDDRERLARLRKNLVELLLLFLGDAFLRFGGGHLAVLVVSRVVTGARADAPVVECRPPVPSVGRVQAATSVVVADSGISSGVRHARAWRGSTLPGTAGCGFLFR